MRLTRRTLDQMASPIGAFSHLLDGVPTDKPLLDLSQGAPGFPPAPVVAARIAEVAAEPDGARYTPQLGLPALRSAFAAEIRRHYGGDVGSDDVAITAGCNQAFCMVTSALTEPGDEVILTLPYYFNHDMWLGMDGVATKYLRPDESFVPTVATAEALVGERTRALVLVTPGNPTGQVLSPELINDFMDLAVSREFVLIVDETYRSFVPGGGAPHTAFDRPGWREHLVSLHSFSKDLAIPGHRVGAVVGHPDLLAEVEKLVDCVTICAPRVGQEAVMAGLAMAKGWQDDMIAEIAAKQARFEQVMATAPGGFRLVTAGAYYGWVGHPFDGRSSEDVARQLLLEQGVLVLPGSAFMPDDPQALRFSFANAPVERLDELDSRLREFAGEPRPN